MFFLACEYLSYILMKNKIKNVPYNLCVLCGNCNSSKKDKYPEEFYSKEKLEKLYLIKGINHATTSRNNHGHCD